MKPLAVRPPAPARAGTIALAMAVAACAGPSGGSPTGGAPEGRPSFLLISLDTTRADRLGCYGFARAATPNLDRWAAEGALFENAATPVPVTLPAHASLLTGLVPNRHGVRNNGTYRLAEQLPTLATLLASAGYDTAAVVGAVVLDRQYGLARGFARYDDRIERTPELESAERDAASVTDAALAAAGSLRKPFLLFVHYYDPHAHYRPPPPFSETFRDSPYDGEIAYVDREIGRLRRGLEARGLLEETVVLVTADHGEGLGEHGEATHGLLLYQSTLRIPLILVAPGRVPAGVRSGVFARLTDVLPTLLELAGVAAPSGLDGRSLLPALRTASRPTEQPPWLLLESDYGYEAYGWAPLRGVTDGRWKWIRAPRPELYDLATDPHERTDLAGREAEAAAKLEATWRELFREDARTRPALEGPHATATSERLRDLASLGYLSAPGRPPAGKETLPDPKDVLGTLEQVDLARRLLRRGRPSEAAALLERVVQATPSNVTALFLLGSAYAKAGLPLRAVPPLEAAAALAPHDANVQFELGAARLAAGDAQRAVLAWQSALALAPRHVEAAVDLVDVLLQLGKVAEATQALRQARAHGLEGPLFDWLEGRAALARGDRAAARDLLERALEGPLPPSIAAQARELLAALRPSS